MAAQQFEPYALSPQGRARLADAVPPLADEMIDRFYDRPVDGRPQPSPDAERLYEFVIARGYGGDARVESVIAKKQADARAQLNVAPGEDAQCRGFIWLDS